MDKEVIILAEERNEQVNAFTLFLILILLILSFPDEHPIKRSIRNLLFGTKQVSDEPEQEESETASAAAPTPVPRWSYNWRVSKGGAEQ